MATTTPNLFFAVLLYFSSATIIDAYKILLLPLPAKSHVFPFFTFGEVLADRDHAITIVLSENLLLDISEERTGSRRGIRIERYKDTADDFQSTLEQFTTMFLENQVVSFREQIPMAVDMVEKLCRTLIINNEDLLQRLGAHHFDLVVVDANVVNKCPYLIPHRLGVPFVTYSDLIDPLVARLPWLPSFVPSCLSAFSDKMTFVQRLANSAIVAATVFVSVVPDSPTEVLDEYRRLYGHFRSLDDLASRSILWLFPREHVLDYARPLMPNVVNVGGLTARRSNGELPADYRSFIEEAPNGAIVVSFGSIAASLPRNIVQKMFDAFRRLDTDGYRFVFRLKNADDVDIPQNVMIRSWLPQSDLLGHGSVKLFITHCGNSGLYEAVYRGVPMIGFPIFGDQPYNANRIQSKGFGLAMDIHEFEVDELVSNIHEIISNSSYKDRVAKASLILRDDPQSPAERAAYWIEHVCRFGGDHLRSAGQDLPLYEYAMLDILGSVLLVIAVAIWLASMLLRVFRAKCRTQQLKHKKII